MNTVNIGSLLVGIGLMGNAVYQFTQGHFDVGIQSFMSALVAFGVNITAKKNAALETDQEQLKAVLNRKGML